MNEDYIVKTAYVTVINKYNRENIIEISEIKDIDFGEKHVVFWMTDNNIRAYKSDNVVEISTEMDYAKF